MLNTLLLQVAVALAAQMAVVAVLEVIGVLFPAKALEADRLLSLP
jgi:hypothetical protein